MSTEKEISTQIIGNKCRNKWQKAATAADMTATQQKKKLF
jgi:hypothetical protein